MHKCDMWKPETDNQAMPPGVLPKEEQQKKTYPG